MSGGLLPSQRPAGKHGSRMPGPPASGIVTVTLNAAIDSTYEVPGLEIGKHAKARLLRRDFAGKAINVSRALSVLGRSSIATGFVGEAEFDAFEQSLHRCGPGRVVCQLLALSGRTRQNFTLLDPEAHTDTHIREQGPEVQRRDWQRIHSKLRLLARPETTFVFAGSLPPGITAQQFRYLLHEVAESGANLVLDLGGEVLRGVVGLKAGGEEQTEELSAGQADEEDPTTETTLRPRMIFPNRQELAALADGDDNLDEAALLRLAQRLAERVGWVFVTLGGDGGMLVAQSEAWRGWLTEPGEMVNTVGSGDCLVAGTLDALQSEAEPEQVLRRGLAAGTANALTDGVAQFESVTVRQIAAKGVSVQRLA